MTPYEKEEALRTLFLGLCRLFEIEIGPADDPDDPFDFCLPAQPGQPVYVVVLAGPADRQVEVAALRFHRNTVLVIDEDDIDQFRRVPGGASAGFMLTRWLRGGTHASMVRERMGISS